MTDQHTTCYQEMLKIALEILTDFPTSTNYSLLADYQKDNLAIAWLTDVKEDAIEALLSSDKLKTFLKCWSNILLTSNCLPIRISSDTRMGKLLHELALQNCQPAADEVLELAREILQQEMNGSD